MRHNGNASDDQNVKLCVLFFIASAFDAHRQMGFVFLFRIHPNHNRNKHCENRY